MIKRVHVLTLLLLSALLVPVLLTSGENVPVIIVIQDLGTKSNPTHRAPAKIPFECHYNPGLGNVIVMFTNPIGNVYVDIDNRTTGEHIDVLITSNVCSDDSVPWYRRFLHHILFFAKW